MPVRIRKTFNIFPGVKANFSKSGISFTVGTKGYHLNFSKRGVRQTVGLPGSGISQTSYLVKNDAKTDAETEKEKERKETEHKTAKDNYQPARVEPREGISGWILFLCLVVVYFGAVILGLIPAGFLSQALGTVLEWIRNITT